MSSSDTPAPGEIDAIRSMLLDGQSVAPELQEIFGEEAEDHLRSIYDGLDRLQVNGSDTAALADIRRAAHTLKGAAGAVGVQSVTRLAHRMEDLLDHLADNGKPSTSEMTLLFLSTTDRIQELTAEEFDIEAMTGSIAELFAQYETLLPGAGQVPQAGASSEAASDVSFDLDEDENDPEMQAALAAFGADFEDEEDDPEMQAALAAFGVEDDSEEENEEEAALLAQLDGGSQPAEAPAITAPVETTTETKTVAAEQSTRESLPPKKEVAATSTPTSSTKNESHIRVPLSRLDEMVRLVGEMIINRSAFAQRLGDFGSQIDDLQVAMSRLRGVSDDIETRYSVEALKQGDLTRPGFQGDQSVTGGRWASVLGSHNGDASGSAHQEFDELEFDRYNEFHLLARTLSEATGDVGSIARECRVLSGDFDALLSRWQRLTRDAQDRLMQIRMVPLRTAIPRLGRAVRSTASQCGKSVEFVVRGDHTEMDKTVLEEIADPLLHLVRNAVDHGIESPDDRRAAGKSEQATLTIEAINQGTQLTLRVEDDGRGLDVERIRKRALERGLIDADDALTDDEVKGLIFAPGFSTASAITDVSGRGVGMDVVRETVQRLKGTIRLDSVPGRGARFTIILPTTLAVTRALVVNAAGLSFAVPMQAIRQISRLDPSNISRIGDDPVVEVEGRTVRLRKLAETLALAPKSDFDVALPMLIVESGDRCVAILVDEIEGGQDIVVKSLGDHLRTVTGIIGATIRGDGSVIPILDPAEMVGLARSLPDSDQFVRAQSKRVGKDRRRNVMIVDDSVSVRRITASVMRGGGWAVTTAKDGVDALEQLSTTDTPPNVILLDMEMPRMDGLELLSNLRTSDEFADTPVVMVTSRAGDKHRKRAMDAGATEYVVKPFRDDQLLEITTRLADRTNSVAGVS